MTLPRVRESWSNTLDPTIPLSDKPETFAIRFPRETAVPELQVVGGDDLGIVYGLLHISHKYLGIDPFWFWADKQPQPNQSVIVPMEEYEAPTPRIRYRGWFVNDEVCLIGWTDTYPPPKEIWQPVFETLLRCGGKYGYSRHRPASQRRPF